MPKKNRNNTSFGPDQYLFRDLKKILEELGVDKIKSASQNPTSHPATSLPYTYRGIIEPQDFVGINDKVLPEYEVASGGNIPKNVSGEYVDKKIAEFETIVHKFRAEDSDKYWTRLISMAIAIITICSGLIYFLNTKDRDYYKTLISEQIRIEFTKVVSERADQSQVDSSSLKRKEKSRTNR